jgi:phospholipid N-methyltransferase
VLTRFLKSPRTIGCVTPSSVSLGRALSEKINQRCSYRVLELGAGTGRITAEILRRLPSPDLLTCLEIDQQMCSQFRASFPGVNLLEKDCREIGSIFAGYEIANIVSSLPYRSLPKSTTDTIFEQKISLSNSQTIISLFSYDFVFSNYHRRYPIKLIDCRTVLLNFPPAKVYHYAL